MIENTCCKSKDCPLWKKYQEKCPNYIESVWTPKETGVEPLLVCDCAPRRTLLMIQELFNRTEGMQQSIEQNRNMTHNLGKAMATMCQLADSRLKQLEQKDILEAETIDV